MAAPSVTYTFSNSTTADATQVNQNFSDIISGLSDGTKDLSINAITCAGTATLNGSVNLGNASGDDLIITASLAGSIPIKTTYSYDIGSATIGLRSVYFGSSDSAARSVRVLAGVVGSSYTFTLPVSAGTSRYILETNGSGVTSWQPRYRSSETLDNLAISTSVGSNALTIALKGADGNDPSSTNPVDIVFRNATSATGTPVTRSVTGALSLVISSGSTLGHASGTTRYIYVYAIDNSGTVELAASSAPFNESVVQSSTAEGGAGAADNNYTLYSSTARTNVPIRMIARLKSNQTTAGTWASSISEIIVGPAQLRGGIIPISLRYTNTAGTSIAASGVTTVVPYATKTFDYYDAYNTSTGDFTAPVAGPYRFSLKAGFDTPGASVVCKLLAYRTSGTSLICLDQYSTQSTGEAAYLMISDLVDLTAGEQIHVRASNSNSSNTALTTSAGCNFLAIDYVGE